MDSLDTNYQKMPEDADSLNDSYTVHVASEGAKARWSHVKNLDYFFRDIYTFHQKKGLLCIVVDEILWMGLFGLVTFGFAYIFHCVNFNFGNVPGLAANRTEMADLNELFLPLSICTTKWGFWTWLLLVLSLFVLLYKIVQTAIKYNEFKNIEMFFESAMKIPKEQIHNITWHEVQCKLREVQHEQQICVHKSDLTEIDIYHRILRYKNYMVALVNKNILPLKYKTPFGEWVYLTSTLEYSIQLLLFESPISPFEKSGHLKEEYKKYSKRKEAAAELSKYILILGILSFFAVPFIFMWRLLSYLLTYSGIVRFDPGFMTVRRWSTYARLYLRHFNELEHELNARLSRAYIPAKDYMKAFPSPLTIIIAKFARQVSSFVVVFFAIWGMYNQKLILFEHVILIISIGAVTFSILTNLIPNEYEIYFPCQLMTKIIAEIHYVPDHFKTMSHTTPVRDEFCHLFHYTLVFILEELLSPIFTPLVLIFHLRPRALDLVDFLRSFTVEVTGVGDVCSFSLMKVSKHGNQEWEIPDLSKADQFQQAEDGKTEMSLIHFTLMNPQWEAPASSKAFMDDFKDQVHNLKDRYPEISENPAYASLYSVDVMGSKYPSLGASLQQSFYPSTSMTTGIYQARSDMRGLNCAEGPSYIEPGLFPGDMPSLSGLNPIEIRNHQMNVSALLLHGIHDQKHESSHIRSGPSSRSAPVPTDNEGDEESPLLNITRSNYVQ